MDLQNALIVPLPMDDAWRVLLDVKLIASCMPGAQLTEVKDDRTFAGKVALRLGPVALAFNGAATIEETDEVDHRVRIRAHGTDTKGRGGADAVVRFQLRSVPDGTEVLVNTSLNLSGTVAQYGRAQGVIHQVAAELTSQFATNLKAEIGRSGLQGGAPASPAQAESTLSKPISGLSLIGRLLWRGLVGMFRRDRPKGH
jgi:carbon monoxide dehydrogenase subunit G